MRHDADFDFFWVHSVHCIYEREHGGYVVTRLTRRIHLRQRCLVAVWWDSEIERSHLGTGSINQ